MRICTDFGVYLKTVENTKPFGEINKIPDGIVENTKPFGEINKTQTKTVENTKSADKIDIFYCCKNYLMHSATRQIGEGLHLRIFRV